jgi:hypothetical protein
LDHDALRPAFDRLWPLLEPAVAEGGDTHSKEDVWREVTTDPQTRFWPGERSAAVTEVLRYPQKEVMNLWLIGGDLDELLTKMLPAAEALARHWGLKEVWGMGRPGWKKPLAPLGYSAPGVIVKKVLA